MVMFQCFFCIVTALLVPVTTALGDNPPHGADTRDLYLQLLNRVENLETRDKHQQAEIDTLRSELHTERQKTSELEKIISQLKKEKDRPTGDDGVQSKSKTPIKITTETNTRGLHSEKVSDEQDSRIRRQDVVPVIAFQATLTSHLDHAGKHQIIAFDNVVTNFGGSYNPHVGIFVAPVSGVYVFSSTLLSYNQQAIHGGIARNGNIIAYMYFTISNSATVVLHLNKGDDIDVQVLDSDKTVHGFHYSMFGGFLLQADQPSVIVGK